jgi:hypothetical protein
MRAFYLEGRFTERHCQEFGTMVAGVIARRSWFRARAVLDANTVEKTSGVPFPAAAKLRGGGSGRVELPASR